MRIIAVFATLLSVATLAVAITSPPSFCNGLDCPLWNTNSTCTGANGTFEIRQYPAYKWVSYNVSQYSYNGAGGIAFQHLFNYLKGTGVKMSAPVLTDIQAGSGPNCNSTFVVSFFLDFINQANPPAVPANAPGDYIQTYPPLTVAVRVFDGWADSWETEVFPQLQTLAQQVTAAGIKVTAGREMVAQYDSPFNIIPQWRHNEVWIPIEGGIPPSCAPQ